ncbi:MAG: LysM peptidoglycan-binding domain-containing protein [Bacteroidia bacterium]|nr:LysM peptidoglycan-binding domain-containing protein [Bacteroidia bacterium]
MTKIKTTYLKFSLSFILCLLSYVCLAQTKSTDIKTINGKKYYIHKVEKGQSLYAIAKIYNMDVNSILAENDEAIDGLKNGQELKIPFESLLTKQTPTIDTNKYVYHKITKGETIYGITKKYGVDEKKLASYNPGLNNGIKEGDYLIIGEKKKGNTPKISSANSITTNMSAVDTYTVLQGETLYGISKKVNVSQENLLKWNPEAKDGVKQGQILKVSSVKTMASVTNHTLAATTHIPESKITELIAKPKKEVYEIGLFLPFKLAESEAINIDELVKAKASFPAAQNLSLDFYFGFKKAVDSLIEKGFEVNLHLFDIDEKDSLQVEAICKTPEFKSLDAIFGPLYAGVFKLVSNHAKKIQVPVISPLTQQNKILYNNTLVSKVNPSLFTLIEGLADYCIDSLMSSSNIIIVNSTVKDRQYIKAFKNRFNEGLSKHNRSKKDSITEVKGVAGVKAAYIPGKKNVVVLFTHNEVYLQDFITQLTIFSDKKEIVLMGFNSVSNIDNLDQDYLNNLQFHFAAPNHIDFKDSVIINLTRQYQSVYTADPSEYYFQGFDIATYYLSNLKTKGPEFFFNLDKNNWEGVSTGFKFYRPDTETGFENRAVYIYKYSNYQLQKLGWK